MTRLFGGVESRSNPLENPSMPLSSVGLLDWLGGSPTESGERVDEAKAFSFAAYWRAVALLSGLIAGLPLKTYKMNDRTETTTVAGVLSPTCSTLSPTSFELWEQVSIHLLTWGNAYVHKVRSGPLDRITDLRPILPSRVKVSIVDGADEDSAPSLTKRFDVTSPSGAIVPMSNYDVMHIPGMGYDGISGLSPVAHARQALGTGLAADRMAGRLFGNGMLLSGVLQVDRQLNQSQSDQLKSHWKSKMSGSAHAHDIAVLDNGAKFVPLTMPPEEAQFLQTRRWQTIEIARWFGIPPHLLGDVEKTTSWGTGIEQQNIAFIAYTLRAWLNRIEQRVTRELLPRGQFAEFLVDGLLRGATGERYAAYAQGIQWGWLTRNEARAKENLAPIDGLDEPLTPLNMSTSIEGEQPAPGAGTGDTTDDGDLADDDDSTDPKG